MREIRRFTVLPRLPDSLAPLLEIARNMSWGWTPEAIDLFRRLDSDLFSATGHNPVKMLGVIDQDRLDHLCNDVGFVTQMKRVAESLRTYLSARTWFQEAHGDLTKCRIAYFSAEFGIHESVPIYSGGLGLLAGDHLKSASDLGIPLIGVGLMYQQGYFRQYLNADGWQQERYPENDFYNMACELQRNKAGEPVLVEIEYPGRKVYAQIWKVQVGRTPLYLLDSNIEKNSPDDRQITAQLYGGDQEMRVRQEVMLGIGGLRALCLLDLEPTVCHMNEGHSAFLAIERICMLMEQKKYDLATARELVTSTNVFTTHTPVEAGNDMFPPYLVDAYLEHYYRRMGMDREAFMELGRQRPEDKSEPFCMTVLAIRLASYINGVSKLHGKVSRRMWSKIWPEVPEVDTPITSITNGIHTKSYMCLPMAQLFDRYLGADWREKPLDFGMWNRVQTIPDAELWRIHENRRDRLIGFARYRLRQQMMSRNASADELRIADEVLAPEVLTIGFARRFATYKRGSLLFRDIERLQRIVNNADRPVQFIFAGKAHPKDHGGKEIIQQIFHLTRRPEFRHRVVFIEDYDINVCRYLVQGVDIWMNNPRRPLEASGTSGMKAPVNGGINLSVLDGWWCEGFETDNGWSIGSGEEYADLHLQDEIESRAIYDRIEKDIAPLFYQRQKDGLPREWIQRVKRSMMTVCPQFNTNRMVHEYTERFYVKAMQNGLKLAADQARNANELANWLHHVRQVWPEVAVENVRAEAAPKLEVGSSVQIAVDVRLGKLDPNQLAVEVYYGAIDANGQINQPQTKLLKPIEANGREVQTYVGNIPCDNSGQHGYSVRVLPHNALQTRSMEPGLIRWG